MAITAADIHNQSFSIDRKGYDVDEVDVFLEHVADEIDGLNKQIDSLQSQLESRARGGLETSVITTNASAIELNATIAEKDGVIARLERQLEERKADDNAIAQALIIAQRSADEILAKANTQATQTVADAREEAQRIVDRANADKQSVIDSIRKLQDDREDAREEYQELLKNFISDASRKLADIGGLAPANPRTYPDVLPSPAATPQKKGAYLVDNPATEMPAATYTTPQADAAVVAAPMPVPTAVEKDLSGFGDVDDSFELDEID